MDVSGKPSSLCLLSPQPSRREGRRFNEVQRFPKQKHINQVLGQIFVKGQMIKRMEESNLTSPSFNFIYVNLVLMVPDSCYSF